MLNKLQILDHLKTFDEGTHTTDWSGVWGAFTHAGNLDWSKVDDLITLRFPEVLETASASGKISAATVLPASLRPTLEQRRVLLSQDNGAEIIGIIKIGTDGSLVISDYADPSGNFSGSGATGFYGQVIQYYK